MKILDIHNNGVDGTPQTAIDSSGNPIKTGDIIEANSLFLNRNKQATIEYINATGEIVVLENHKTTILSPERVSLVKSSTEQSTSDIKSKISFGVLEGGAKPNNKHSKNTKNWLDIRSANGIVDINGNRPNTEKGFAITVAKKKSDGSTVNMRVVGVRLDLHNKTINKIFKSTDSSRNGLIWTSIEDNGNLPSNIDSILLDAAMESIESAYPQLKGIQEGISKPESSSIKASETTVEQSTPQPVQEISTPVEVPSVEREKQPIPNRPDAQYLSGMVRGTFNTTDSSPEGAYFRIYDINGDTAKYEYSGEDDYAIARQVVNSDNAKYIGNPRTAFFINTEKAGTVRKNSDGGWAIVEKASIVLGPTRAAKEASTPTRKGAKRGGMQVNTAVSVNNASNASEGSGVKVNTPAEVQEKINENKEKHRKDCNSINLR